MEYEHFNHHGLQLNYILYTAFTHTHKVNQSIQEKIQHCKYSYEDAYVKIKYIIFTLIETWSDVIVNSQYLVIHIDLILL